MTRILAVDTSLSCCGVSIVSITKGKAKVEHVAHYAPNSKYSTAQRAELMEAWATLYIGATLRRGFDILVRENFRGQTSNQNHPVHSAWSAWDRALLKFGLEFNVKPITPSSVKKTLTGRGKAEKDEVADVTRKLTGYEGEYATDDESDAVAIALAYALQNGLLKLE